MKFEVQVKVEYEVEITDPVFAEEYFIDSDWSEYFFDFLDLEDMVDHITLNFKKLETHQWSPTLEGFGTFEFDTDLGKHVCQVDDDSGKEVTKIIISAVEEDHINW